MASVTLHRACWIVLNRNGRNIQAIRWSMSYDINLTASSSLPQCCWGIFHKHNIRAVGHTRHVIHLATYVILVLRTCGVLWPSSSSGKKKRLGLNVWSSKYGRDAQIVAYRDLRAFKNVYEWWKHIAFHTMSTRRYKKKNTHTLSLSLSRNSVVGPIQKKGWSIVGRFLARIFDLCHVCDTSIHKCYGATKKNLSTRMKNNLWDNIELHIYYINMPIWMD